MIKPFKIEISDRELEETYIKVKNYLLILIKDKYKVVLVIIRF